MLENCNKNIVERIPKYYMREPKHISKEENITYETEHMVNKKES